MKKEKKAEVDVKAIATEVAKETAKELLAELNTKKEKKITAPAIVKKELSDDQKAVKFLKALYNNDKKGMAEVGHKDVTTGSISIPQSWANSISRLLGEGAVARQNSLVMPMPRATLNLPKGNANATAYWVAEAGSITESDPTFANTQLSAKKLAAYVELSSEVIEDANADIVQFITDGIVEQLQREETNQWLNGSGSSPAITGALQSTAVTSVVMGSGDTSFADVTSDDIIDLINAVPSYRRTGSVFVMSDYVFGLVKKLKDSSNRPLYQALTEAERGLLAGYPVRIAQDSPDSGDDGVSTAFMLFGNTKKGMVIGDRKLVTFDMSKDFKFQSDMVALRAIERIDIAVHMGGYMAKLVTAAS